MNNNTNIVKYLSLFSCGGIGTYLLKDIGFKCAVSNELDVVRATYHQDLYKDDKMIIGNIREKKKEIIQSYIETGCSGILASPICQPFSLAGGQHLNDPETLLFLDVLDITKATNPDFLLIENVPYFISDKQSPIITDKLGGKTIKQYITDFLTNIGYEVNINTIKACDYGTAQKRKRGIILACKKEFGKWNFPKKDDKILTLKDVIGNGRFKSLEPGERDKNNPLHYAEYVNPDQAECLRHTPTGQSALLNIGKWKIKNINGTESKAQHKSAFGRAKWDEPCPTIVMSSDSISGDWSVHPGYKKTDDTYSDPRPFSIAELFAITGLPDTYYNDIPDWAKGNHKLLRQLVGESFCPLVVKRLMQELKKILPTFKS